MRASCCREAFALALGLAAPVLGEAWRAAIEPPVERGWQRLVLSAHAQRDTGTLWLSDATGDPRPFLRVDEWQRRRSPVALDEVVIGRDAAGHPIVELTPISVADAGLPRQIHFGFELSGETPWIARLEVERRRGGGAWIARDGEPIWLDDLGNGRRRVEASLPWDGERYRLRLVALEAARLTLSGVDAEADVLPDLARTEQTVELTVRELEATRAERRWVLRLAERDRLLGVELELAAPLAPVAVELRQPMTEPRGPGPLIGRGSVWNLPALDARQGRADLVRPLVLDELELWTPRGVVVTSARAVVRRETLLFPAERGSQLYLHGGAEVRAAIGDLSPLRLDRQATERSPLGLGAPEEDPHAVHNHPTLAGQLRRFLVPVVILVAALLAAAAWRLFRGSDPETGAKR